MKAVAVLVGLVLLSGLAGIWPTWFEGVPDPFLGSRSSLWGLIALTMFAIGWRLPRDEVREVAHRWPVVFGGTIIQYTVMPVLSYIAATTLQFDESTTVGIILVGCVPGAMASNVLTLLARGNVSYSVSLTTLATLVSPLIVPLVLKLALNGISVDFPLTTTIRQLSLYVVLPVIAGHLLGRLIQRRDQWSATISALVANLVILWIIAVVVASNRDRFGSIDARIFFALLLVNALGYVAGQLGGRALRIGPSMRRALTLEVGMQNAGLGSTLALALFPDQPEVAIPCAFYTFGCMLTGTGLAVWWSRHSARY